MTQKIKIDMWVSQINPNKEGKVEIVENILVIYNIDDKYSVQIDTIEEVNIYKSDHMSFDTLILRITTNVHEFELPYCIEFQNYLKDNAEWIIPQFTLRPIISGFGELIKWMNTNLPNFNPIWLDESKPIVDNTNMVCNYKKITF